MDLCQALPQKHVPRTRNAFGESMMVNFLTLVVELIDELLIAHTVETLTVRRSIRDLRVS